MMVDAVAAAGALLPAYVRWGSTLYIPATFVAAWALTCLAVRVAMLRAPEPADPWPERARAAYPARSTLRLANVFLPAIAGIGSVTAAGPFSALPPAVLGLGAALAAPVGAELVRPRLVRAIGLPSYPLPARLRANAKRPVYPGGSDGRALPS